MLSFPRNIRILHFFLSFKLYCIHESKVFALLFQETMECCLYCIHDSFIFASCFAKKHWNDVFFLSFALFFQPRNIVMFPFSPSFKIYYKYFLSFYFAFPRNIGMLSFSFLSSSITYTILVHVLFFHTINIEMFSCPFFQNLHITYFSLFLLCFFKEAKEFCPCPFFQTQLHTSFIFCFFQDTLKLFC